jgi:hypothetical protein
MHLTDPTACECWYSSGLYLPYGQRNEMDAPAYGAYDAAQIELPNDRTAEPRRLFIRS